MESCCCPRNPKNVTADYTCSDCGLPIPEIIAATRNLELEIDELRQKYDEIIEQLNLKEEELDKISLENIKLRETEKYLSSQVQRLSEHLIEESELRKKHEKERDELNCEVEELTKKLFEEANSMVQKETKARHSIQTSMKLLEEKVKYLEKENEKLSKSGVDDRARNLTESVVFTNEVTSLFEFGDQFPDEVFDAISDASFSKFVNYLLYLTTGSKLDFFDHEFIKEIMDTTIFPCILFDKVDPKKLLDAIVELKVEIESGNGNSKGDCELCGEPVEIAASTVRLDGKNMNADIFCTEKINSVVYLVKILKQLKSMEQMKSFEMETSYLLFINAIRRIFYANHNMTRVMLMFDNYIGVE